MSACQSCGAALSADSRFCQSCGSPVELGADVSVQAVESSDGAAVVHPPVDSGSRPLETNLAGALTYLGGIVTGILFLALDPYKGNSFVRFHAFQSILFNVAWIAVWIVWMMLSAALTPLRSRASGSIAVPLMLIFTVAGFGVWIFLMYQAYQQKLFRLPIVGKFAAEYAGVRL